MASHLESMFGHSLWTAIRDVPIGAGIPDSESLREALSALERILPSVLEEVNPEWKYRALDGIFPFETLRVGEAEIELFGLAIDLPDNELALLHLRLQLSESHDDVSWLELRIEIEGMLNEPYSSLSGMGRQVQRLMANVARVEDLNWRYHVSFGERGLKR